MTAHPEFFDNADFAWTQVLEERFPAIRAELDALTDSNFGEWPRGHMFDNKWNLFPFLTPGREFEDNQKVCPETTAALKQIPGLTMGVFSWLRAGSAIKPHVGFTDVVLRSHLAVKVPQSGEDFGFRVGESTRQWEEGKVMVFDDMHNHEAWNRTEEDRVVLMIDFLRPWKWRTSSLGYLRHRVALPDFYKHSYDRVYWEASKEVEDEDPRA
jgi:aspartyl/asparaginyl beta-hydroxylase (cupin superfamily)